MNWGGAFDREPLGFDTGTPARVGRDVSGAVERVAHSPASLLREAATLGWAFWAALGGLVAFILAGTAIERRRPRTLRRVWVRLRAASRRNAVWRSVSRILERAALPLSALTLWTVGSLLTGAESAAVVLIQNLLGIWAGFRLADEGLRQLLCGGGRTPAALYGALHGLFVFAAFWLSGWLLMDAATYREDAIALWLAAGHLTLVLCLFGILLRRDQLLALLPELDSSVYRTFLRVIRAVYYPLIYGSFLVALLWVGGYQKLAGLFLGRSWAVVGTCLAALLAYRLALQLLRRWIGDDPEGLTSGSETLAAGQRVLEAVAAGIALVLSLKALGIWTPLAQSMGRTLLKLGDLRLTGGTLAATLLIFAAVVMISRLIQALLALRVYPRVGVARGEAYALNRLLHYALMAGALLLALNTLGLSPASLALVLGGLSVGIGFGLQDIANNIASGLIMLTSRQVRQGDVITVGDRMGTVREVNLRSTVVTTPDNVDLLIPNSKLLGDTVINWTHSSSSVRTKIPFGVSYDSNPREVIELALAIGRGHPEVLTEPEPAAWLLELGDNSLNFELYVWVDLATSVRPQVVTEIYCRLFEELQARGIQIPYPQRDLHLRSGVPWEELIGALKSHGEGRLPDGREPRNGQSDAVTPQARDGR